MAALKVSIESAIIKTEETVDTFVKMYYDGQKYKTFVKTQSRFPQWHAHFKVPHSASNGIMRFELVRLMAMGGANITLGALELNVSSMTPGTVSKGSYQFSGVDAELKIEIIMTTEARPVKSAHKPQKVESKKLDDGNVFFVAASSSDDSVEGQQADLSPLGMLKDEFPRLSDAEISNTLNDCGGRVDDARQRLLDMCLGGGQAALTSKCPKLSPPQIITPTGQAYQAPPKKSYNLTAEQAKKAQKLQADFPKISFTRVVEALVNNKWKKSAAIDELLSDQIATTAVVYNQQIMATMAAGQAHQPPAGGGGLLAPQAGGGMGMTFMDFGKVHKPPSSPMLVPHQQVGLKPAAHVATKPTDFIQPSGRRKALCIGINYIGQNRALRGCIPDAERMRKMVTSLFGFPDRPDCITMLTDDAKHPSMQPTRSNIIKAIQWLVEGAKRGDIMFFHFSGHGSRTRDLSGDEESGQDNTILPSDYRTAGPILDDELNEKMVACLPEGTKLIAVMDCCHSGTGLDLPHSFVVETNSWKTDKNPKLCEADVMMFSGCRDDQTSADVMIPSKGSGGAMSMAVLSTLSSNPFNQSLSGLMKEIQGIMKQRGFAQRPQLSSTQKLAPNQKLSFVEIVPNVNANIGREKPKPVATPKKKMVHAHSQAPVMAGGHGSHQVASPEKKSKDKTKKDKKDKKDKDKKPKKDKKDKKSKKEKPKTKKQKYPGAPNYKFKGRGADEVSGEYFTSGSSSTSSSSSSSSSSSAPRRRTKA